MLLGNSHTIVPKQVAGGKLPALIRCVVRRLRAQVVKPEVGNPFRHFRVRFDGCFLGSGEMLAQYCLGQPFPLQVDQQRSRCGFRQLFAGVNPVDQFRQFAGDDNP